MGAASHLLQGGFNYNSMNDAKHLMSGARDFFKGLQHRDEQQGDRLEGKCFCRPPSGDSYLFAEEDFVEDWSREGKTVFMFSGCKDEQTSADATIGGQHVG